MRLKANFEIPLKWFCWVMNYFHHWDSTSMVCMGTIVAVPGGRTLCPARWGAGSSQEIHNQHTSSMDEFWPFVNSRQMAGTKMNCLCILLYFLMTATSRVRHWITGCPPRPLLSTVKHQGPPQRARNEQEPSEGTCAHKGNAPFRGNNGMLIEVKANISSGRHRSHPSSCTSR